MKIYAVGPAGSYGMHVAARVNQESVAPILPQNIHPCTDHTDVFESLLADTDIHSIGVVAIENSIHGLVGEVANFWMSHPTRSLKVIGERRMRIYHRLLVRPEVSTIQFIEQVMSHAQALGQCSRYLDSVAITTRIPVASTAHAAEYIARNELAGNMAAIASEYAAKIYGLKVMTHTSIANHPHNTTRFHIVSRTNGSLGLESKTALIFWTKNVPGALAKVLQCFADAGRNISSLHSIPLGTLGTYAFYCEVDHSLHDADGSGFIVQTLAKVTEKVRIIGSFLKYSRAIVQV